MTLFYSPLVVSVTPVDSLVLVTPLSATVGSTFSFSYQCASGPSLQIFSTDDSLTSSAQLGLPVTGNGLDYSQTVVVQAAGAYVGKLTCGTSVRQSAVFNVQPKRRATLIAMGDSYSSGEGNAPFDEGTDTARNKCHRSSNAWPRYLSRLDASGVHLISHIACSGAVIPSLTASYKTEPAQLNQLANLARPDIITITLGGNDVGFATVVRNCYLTLNCDKTLVKDAEKAISGPALPLTAVGFDGLVQELTAALQAVKAIRPNARVILVGYPNIFPTSSAAAMRCGWLSEAERVSLVRLAGLLNDAATTAAASAGAEFVTTLDALAGHELCTADSWVVPVGLFTGAQLQQNAHPMALGQFAMAKRVEVYLNGGL
ncbi:MAG: SGNH/GDSL hydrolase family protein [Chloroflexota bacterium]|nr:SGNH/GDSL hydrolase family protein [Chloroflexota bacterium]